MAKLILKSKYLKAGNKGHSSNLVQYIAKREGVEKIDDSWREKPATQEQITLINKLIIKFPETKDSFEYRDYEKNRTQGIASEYITRAIEDNADLLGKRENYVSYIAMRPRVEKTGTHGLFTDANVPIKLSDVAKQVAEHKGNVWTNIISLRREDAERLGYDHGSAWRNLIRAHAETMAKSMKIPVEDLRWYAAFHNESYHPHVHVIAYSVGKEPYLTERGIDQMRSAFARDIFKQDLYHIYEEQTTYRDDLRKASREVLENIVNEINDGTYKNETVEALLRKLTETLDGYTGKKVYGYLPKPAKNLINGIVDELAKDKRIAELYKLWYEQREKVIGIYREEMPERIPLSANSEFKSIRNAVLKEAMNITVTENDNEDIGYYQTDSRDREYSYDEEDITNVKESDNYSKGSKSREYKKEASAQTSVALASFRLFMSLAQLIQDNIRRNDEHDERVDRKLNKRIQDKKSAHGQKMGG